MVFRSTRHQAVENAGVYGIENYCPRHAYEAVLRRDLKKYFPIPPERPIEQHFCEPRPLWPRCLNRLRKKKPTPFYQKRRNAEIAKHLTITDVKDTDLQTIFDDVKRRADDARRY